MNIFYELKILVNLNLFNFFFYLLFDSYAQ